MSQAIDLHPFEAANLGVGPFRCIGMVTKRLASGQPAGTCQYCGNGILYCYRIRSADGREFVVGSDCVLRTGSAHAGDALLVEVRKLMLAERRAKNDAKREAARDRRATSTSLSRWKGSDAARLCRVDAEVRRPVRED